MTTISLASAPYHHLAQHDYHQGEQARYLREPLQRCVSLLGPGIPTKRLSQRVSLSPRRTTTRRSMRSLMSPTCRSSRRCRALPPRVSSRPNSHGNGTTTPSPPRASSSSVNGAFPPLTPLACVPIGGGLTLSRRTQAEPPIRNRPRHTQKGRTSPSPRWSPPWPGRRRWCLPRTPRRRPRRLPQEGGRRCTRRVQAAVRRCRTGRAQGVELLIIIGVRAAALCSSSLHPKV